MQACTLLMIYVAVQNTADNMSELLTKVSDEWGITNKVQAVVTDNGANMVSAVRNQLETHSMYFPYPQLICEGLYKSRCMFGVHPGKMQFYCSVLQP